MSVSRLSVERSARVYDDDHGYWVSVGPDRDGLGNAEIIYSDGDKGAVKHAIAVPWPHMVALAHAILETASRQRGDHMNTSQGEG